jgi:hypothetical protein
VLLYMILWNLYSSIDDDFLSPSVHPSGRLNSISTTIEGGSGLLRFKRITTIEGVLGC